MCKGKNLYLWYSYHFENTVNNNPTEESIEHNNKVAIDFVVVVSDLDLSCFLSDAALKRKITVDNMD